MSLNFTDSMTTDVSEPARGRLDTAFTETLREVVARVPGARGAIFVDSEGEAVDEFAQMPTTEIRLLGAHLGILIALVRERAAFMGEPTELCIEAERAIMLVCSIGPSYLIALEAEPQAPLGIMRREMQRAVESLRVQI